MGSWGGIWRLGCALSEESGDGENRTWVILTEGAVFVPTFTLCRVFTDFAFWLCLDSYSVSLFFLAWLLLFVRLSAPAFFH